MDCLHCSGHPMSRSLRSRSVAIPLLTIGPSSARSRSAQAGFAAVRGGVRSHEAGPGAGLPMTHQGRKSPVLRGLEHVERGLDARQRNPRAEKALSTSRGAAPLTHATRGGG